jgi:hypothetical protein
MRNLDGLTPDRALEVCARDFDESIRRLLKRNAAEWKRDGMPPEQIKTAIEWQARKYQEDRPAYLQQIRDWLLLEDDIVSTLH